MLPRQNCLAHFEILAILKKIFLRIKKSRMKEEEEKKLRIQEERKYI